MKIEIENLKALIYGREELTMYQKALAMNEWSKLQLYIGDLEKLNQVDVSNSFCDLYKKECMGGFCSVTPFPEKCKHRKQNDC